MRTTTLSVGLYAVKSSYIKQRRNLNFALPLVGERALLAGKQRGVCISLPRGTATPVTARSETTPDTVYKSHVTLTQLSLAKGCFQVFIPFSFLFYTVHYERPELEARRTYAHTHHPSAHHHFLRKASEKTSNPYLLVHTCCASRDTKEQALP